MTISSALAVVLLPRTGVAGDDKLKVERKILMGYIDTYGESPTAVIDEVFTAFERFNADPAAKSPVLEVASVNKEVTVSVTQRNPVTVQLDMFLQHGTCIVHDGTIDVELVIKQLFADPDSLVYSMQRDGTVLVSGVAFTLTSAGDSLRINANGECVVIGTAWEGKTLQGWALEGARGSTKASYPLLRYVTQHSRALPPEMPMPFVRYAVVLSNAPRVFGILLAAARATTRPGTTQSTEGGTATTTLGSR